MGKKKMGQMTQQQKNYQKLYNEVSKRAYLGAIQCQQCSHYLPYVGYSHVCLIRYAKQYERPNDAHTYMKQYISQQMAQLAMATI